MAQLIPLSDDARQTFRIILGGSTVRLRVWWQPLDENWYLSLAAPDTTPIISGVRVDEAGAPLTARQLDFEGGLLVDGQGPVRRRAWTTTHKLLYLTEAEVAAHAARRAAAPFAGVGYPGAPASFAAVGRYRSAALSFRAGAAGASAITGWQYRLRMEDGSYGDWIDIPGSGPATTAHTVTGLANNIPFFVQVRALSASGWGAPSNEARAVPRIAPTTLSWRGERLNWLGDPLFWDPGNTR